VNKKFRRFSKISMYGVTQSHISKLEHKVSHYGAKSDVDMNKDICINWCNDPAEQSGIFAKYSPTKLR